MPLRWHRATNLYLISDCYRYGIKRTIRGSSIIYEAVRRLAIAGHGPGTIKGRNGQHSQFSGQDAQQACEDDLARLLAAGPDAESDRDDGDGRIGP